MTTKPINLAVLLSGGGRTLINLHEHIESGKLDARIEVVVSSSASCRGVERARGRGLRTVIVDPRTMGDEEFHERISNTVESADLVCLAGFLFLWRIPEPFIGRVINIHPALLPEFGGKGMYGHHVHEAVLTAGRKESGCTVHFCDNQYDHGPIILQRRVPVLPGDTPDILAARVFEQECIAYPQAVQLIAEGRVRLEDGVVMQSGAVTRR
jgi:formyltetrahydrofolate-dependent phosphoribosylglycinamide formyltransferase